VSFNLLNEFLTY